MAYAQWVSFKIVPILCDLTINDIKIDWGKLHEKNKKGDEVNANTINGTVVKDGKDFTFYACGRSDSASGTEGKFCLYYNNEKFATIYWDCPWGSKTNTCTLTKEDGFKQLIVEIDGINTDSGALGNITVTVMKKPN